MKKGIILCALVTLALIGFAAAACELNVALINQDPYPATPGEYVKVVFQINGTETTECNEVFFDVVPEYPFSVESSDTRTVIAGGTYISGYQSFLLKAFKLRVDKDALDGDNKIKVSYGFKTGGTSNSYTKEFDINIKDARTDFEISVQDYDAAKNIVTFGIINVGKYDAESLTLELPDQENLFIKGGNPIIIGGLDSNDDTTATIDAIPKAGEIKVKISYNDDVNARRTVEKEIFFPAQLLQNGVEKTTRDKFFYLFWLILIVFIGKALWNWRQRRKAKNSKLNLIRR